MYNGIFLGYQNTMHNIRYWEVITGIIKTVKHNSKDKIQYVEDIENRSSPINSPYGSFRRKYSTYNKDRA